MNCEPCGKSFNGMAPYQQHLVSEKHKKKLAMLNYLDGNKPRVPQLNGVSAASSSNCIHCPVCNVSFESILLFQDHSLSLEHANNVRKQSAESSVALDVSSTTVNSIQNDDCILPNDDSILQNTGEPESSLISFCECKVCDKQFSGPEPYRQHLVSVAHKKKVDMTSYLVSQNQVSRFSCDTCQKNFSGHIPFQQHMVSDVHKKKLNQLELLKKYQEQAGNSSETRLMEVDSVSSPSIAAKKLENPQAWFCSVCLVQCSGPAPYDQHIRGEAHAKNLKRKEFLSHTPVLKAKSDASANEVRDSKSGLPNLASPLLHVGVRNSMDVENDCILPEALNYLSVINPQDLDVKEFHPDDKIDFDASFSEKNVAVEGMEDNNSEMEVNGDPKVENLMIDNEKPVERVTGSKGLEEYEKCDLCNVMLTSKEETKSHYESIEHIRKKYHDHFV